MRVLITGGAGFIGSRLTERLNREGCQVTVLDSFSPQIHGAGPYPKELPFAKKLLVGEIQNPEIVAESIAGQDVVVHLAAETGTGQSMYEILRYEEVNVRGTAVLIDAIATQRARSIKKLVVASSRAVYGEGKYVCPEHNSVYPSARTQHDLESGVFEPRCPFCGTLTQSLPTDESTPFAPASFYGLTKQVQEQMTIMFAQSLGISGFALRYQNVYGPGQSLLNPYTGILAIFSNLARAGKDITVFEDGLESRDFVYVEDVVEATWRCIQPAAAGVGVFNVGSGTRTSVLQVVDQITRFFDSRSQIKVSGQFRLGDIRHNVADLGKIERELGFSPHWTFEKGVVKFLEWAHSQEEVDLRFDRSLDEMKQRNLLLGGAHT